MKPDYASVLLFINAVKIADVMEAIRKNPYYDSGLSNNEIIACNSIMSLKKSQEVKRRKVVLIPPMEKMSVKKRIKKRTKEDIENHIKKIDRIKKLKLDGKLKCNWCENTNVRTWRMGPGGNYLCNACGLQYHRGHSKIEAKNKVKKDRGIWKKNYI